jgi:eukaryotic-like serine/threonine-protein kinase
MTDSSSRVPVKPGELLAGKYKVEAVLGEGGMGVVVAATHVQLEKRVALKFMLPAALADKEAVERFLREARSAVQLTSEHVARVLDVGTLDSGAPYIVMELLEGQTLEQLLTAEKRLPVGDAVEFVVQVCEAVAEAHARNIVHRDLKPANLFLTHRADKKPLVKVLDFGLSKIIGPNARRITQDLAVMGTPEYMSPEQLRSTKDVDTRADLWSLGVILYELIAGETPFTKGSVAEVCSCVLNDPPRPLSELVADVPEGLVAILEKSLQKDASQRFQDVASFAEALEPFVPRGTVRPGDRIRRVQFDTVAPPKWSKLEVSDAPTLLATAPKAQKTGVSWGTELRPQRSARQWGALAAIVVGVVGALYFVQAASGARAAHPAAVPVALAVPAPVPPPSAAVPTPLDTALATASSATPPAASAWDAGAAVAPRKAVAHPPTRPKPSRDKLLESR